ncbi:MULTISPECIES: Fur family transcriptional regulator [Malaciobacter]|jgi:Fur family ferric uptake transcriptional regulator|uniref:Ferric uptake regulation protein n=2 Tax=Malaciobacter TaxID=2321114 RepID=A0A1T4ZR93_9BACT|nr:MULTISPECIES: Fur family transcriptional regulator [Malaciobacter]AXX87916.1 ferric uptake regulation protein [Malaciobacter marinus]PHO10049.1 transcriptional repressor [Malaciobacter canalis]PHO13219.1 transcriptional repressor [Malaciobacter marinus]PHO14132.1 transcriptional repressor [Malaciobacter marinus]PPK62418.1 Fur family ferric uptake transcriptional regulator [Malaciobacter marinus]
MTNNNNEEVIEELKRIVKQKGLKYTEQREIVLDILINAEDHLSAEDVYNQIKTKYSDSNIGIATVYRALGFLEEVNLITSIAFGTEGKKYESNAKSHHDHLICTSCGKIVEFLDDEIEKRQDRIAKKNKFKITSHSMQLYGTCKDCQEEK